MSSVEILVDKLKQKYRGGLPFKEICEAEGIIVAKGRLEEGLDGFYMSVNGLRVIILNQSLSFWERRDRAFHELWHHFSSPSDGIVSYRSNKKDERKADLFAALCRIPRINESDTIESLQERYNVSAYLAKIRIEHELKKLNQ